MGLFPCGPCQRMRLNNGTREVQSEGGKTQLYSLFSWCSFEDDWCFWWIPKTAFLNEQLKGLKGDISVCFFPHLEQGLGFSHGNWLPCMLGYVHWWIVGPHRHPADSQGEEMRSMPSVRLRWGILNPRWISGYAGLFTVCGLAGMRDEVEWDVMMYQCVE